MFTVFMQSFINTIQNFYTSLILKIEITLHSFEITHSKQFINISSLSKSSPGLMAISKGVLSDRT